MGIAEKSKKIGRHRWQNAASQEQF